MNDIKRKDDRGNSKNVLDSFTPIDEAIDLSIQEEYLSFSETIDFENVDYEEVLTESDRLFDEHTPIESKKRILILLAHLGTPESCRTIEKYLKISKGNLRDWALFRPGEYPAPWGEGFSPLWLLIPRCLRRGSSLSLKECRMFLANVLLHEEGGFISTGLGGKDGKLRYYFIVSSQDGLPFSETHRILSKKGLKKSVINISRRLKKLILKLIME